MLKRRYHGGRTEVLRRYYGGIRGRGGCGRRGMKCRKLGSDASLRRPHLPKAGRFDETSLPCPAGVGTLAPPVPGSEQRLTARVDFPTGTAEHRHRSAELRMTSEKPSPLYILSRLRT